jgi:hypothetical protein
LKIVFITLASYLLLGFNRIDAKPIYVNASDFPQLIGYQRNQIVVAKSLHGTNVQLPVLQRPIILPRNRHGSILWFKDENWKVQNVADRDQFILESNFFAPNTMKAPSLNDCLPKNGIRITSSSSDQAFLYACPLWFVQNLDVGGPKVGYDLSKNYLESRHYKYTYKSENHMLFQKILLKSDSDVDVEIATDADLLIRSDIKRFFSMQFDSDDIESKLKHTRPDTFASFATLGFYLNILFFKISLDLDTDARFYEDSAHIPMTLTVPVNATEKLHPKSGVLYHFLPSADAKVQSLDYIPQFRTNLQAERDLSTYCKGQYCDFSVEFQNSKSKHTGSFKLEFKLPRDQVNLKMYPQYVDDVNKYAKEMNWRLSKDHQNQRRAGLYFEVSGLNSGEYPWDFWMSLK